MLGQKIMFPTGSNTIIIHVKISCPKELSKTNYNWFAVSSQEEGKSLKQVFTIC